MSPVSRRWSDRLVLVALIQSVLIALFMLAHFDWWPVRYVLGTAVETPAVALWVALIVGLPAVWLLCWLGGRAWDGLLRVLDIT